MAGPETRINMSKSGHFNEHAAYSKILLVLMKCGTEVLRRLLNDQINLYRQTLDSFLASRKQKLLNTTVGKMNSTDLFPLNSKPADIKSWDICLLVHVLKEACPNLPQKAVQSLNSFRNIRNKVAHSESASISFTEFTDCWEKTENSLRDVLAVINDKVLIDEIENDKSNIEKGLLVQDVAEYQRGIHYWYQLDTLTDEKIEELKESEYKQKDMRF